MKATLNKPDDRSDSFDNDEDRFLNVADRFASNLVATANDVVLIANLSLVHLGKSNAKLNYIDEDSRGGVINDKNIYGKAD